MTPLKSDSSKKMDVEEESCHQGRLRGCLITPERHVAPESGYVMDAAKEREREAAAGCSLVAAAGTAAAAAAASALSSSSLTAFRQFFTC